MRMIDRTEDMASRYSGTLIAILLLIQAVILPGLGWTLVKIDSIQGSSAATATDVAIAGDRQVRQGADIIDIKNTLKGAETKEDAKAAHQKIWQTDQDQYQRIDQLDQGQRKLESRVQRLETESNRDNH